MPLRSLTPLRVSLALSAAVFACSSVASALVTVPAGEHRWRFDETSGAVAYDDIGTLDGALGGSTTRAAGPFGSNVITIAPTGSYDVAGYVDFGSAAGAFGAEDFTITHWYQTTFNTIGAHGDIIGNRVAGSLGNYFSARLLGNGQVSVELSQDGSGAGYIALAGASSFGVNDGNWHHLAYIREGATLSLYIDGVLADSRSSGAKQIASVLGKSSFRIGRRLPLGYSNFHTIPASYEDVRIFARALDENEILDIIDGTL